jgi:integrase
MPAKLASNLVISRHGIYYLRTTVDGREKRVSLRTRNPAAAKLAAYKFGAAMMSGKFDLKVKLPSGVEIETDGSAEERDAVLDLLKTLEITPPRPGGQFDTDRFEDLTPVSVEHATRMYMLYRLDQITAGTKRTWQTSFNKLNAALGQRLAHELTSQEVSAVLQNIGVIAAPKTVKKDAQTWAMLWRWLKEHNHVRDEKTVKIPTWGRAQLVRLTQERGRDRLSYEQGDLNKIFDPARLNSLTRPEDVFLPILALYTGARLEALCRLKCCDFTSNSLRFDAGHDKTGKERTIPLHPSLIDAGILGYVDEVRAAYGTDSRIFPHLNEVRGRFGHYFSKQFGEQRKALGIADGKDFHSFRVHLVSHLQAAGCPADLRRFFVGHETGEKLDVHERTYSKATFTADQLAELVFPYITITRPAWRYTIGIGGEQVAALMRKKTINAARRARRK